jgi:hypothetical protein
VGPNGVYVTSWTPGSLHIQDTASNVVDSAFDPGNNGWGFDGFLFCFSFAGVFRWQASVTGSSATDAGEAVAFDPSGNVYWAGSFNGCCPSQGGATLTGGDGSSLALSSPSYGTAFLAKLSSVGAPLWVATAYNRDATFYNVAVDSQGSVYVAAFASAWSAGTSTTVRSADGSTASVSNPVLRSHPLLKFNSAGILQWSVPIFGAPGDPDLVDLYALCSTAANDVVVAGRYSSATLTFGSTDSVNKQLPGGTGWDGFVATYSSNGVAKWAVPVGGSSDQAVSAITTEGTNLWAGGTTAGGISVPGVTFAGLGGQDGFVLQMSSSGQALGGSVLGGANSDSLTSLQGGNGLKLLAGNQGGNFAGMGVQITNAGPFVLTSFGGPWITLLRAVKPSLSGLSLGTNYQLQVSGDLRTWTNQGSPFTATNTSMVYPQYWDVDNWAMLFFRVQSAP